MVALIVSSPIEKRRLVHLHRIPRMQNESPVHLDPLLMTIP